MMRTRLVLLPSAVESRLKEGSIWRKWCDLVVLVVYEDTLVPVDIRDCGGRSEDSVYEEAMWRTEIEMLPPFDQHPVGLALGVGQNFGATAVVTDKIKRIMAEVDNNWILIPTSVHEFVIVDEGEYDENDLLCMLREANRDDSIVKPSEVLSDNLYYYDAITGEFSILEVEE